MEHEADYIDRHGFYRLIYSEERKLTPEMAQVARAIVQQNMLMVNSLFAKGLVNQNQINEIMDDVEILDQYTDMIDAEEMGLADSFDIIFEDIKDHPVLFSGWLLFQNEYLNAKYKLNFFSKSEADYKYEDFLGKYG